MTGHSKGRGVTPRYIKNNHRTRVRFEEQGIGLLASGSYVCPMINLSAIKKLVGVKPPREGELVFQDIKSPLGEIVRPVKMAEDGKLYAVGHKVMSSDIFPEKFISFISLPALLRRCKEEGQPIRVKTRSDGSVVEGICLGNLEKPYATLVFANRGKVSTMDLETKKNSHNAKVVVSVLEPPKDKKRVYQHLVGATQQTVKLTSSHRR